METGIICAVKKLLTLAGTEIVLNDMNEGAVCKLYKVLLIDFSCKISRDSF